MSKRKNQFTGTCLFIGSLVLIGTGCQTTRRPSAIRSSDNSTYLVQVSEDSNSLMWPEGRTAPKNLPNLTTIDGQKKSADSVSLQMRAELLLLGHMSRAATEHARSILKTDFRNVRAMKTLIKSALMERKPHEALGLLNSAIVLAPQDAELLSYEGLANHQLENILMAKSLWNKALMLNPEHIPTLMNLAVLLFQNGLAKQAGAYFDRVLTIQPQHLDALVGRALVQSADGQYEQAILALENILKKTGDQALVLENLANISRYRLKDYKKASQYVERTLALGKADRRSIETAVGMKQELRRLIASQEKHLSDENLRDMAARSAVSNSETRADISNNEPAGKATELEKMEDVLK